MIVAVAKESSPGERRVALVPGAVAALVKAGMEVVVQAGAGEAAGLPDALFAEKGAKIASNPGEIHAADVLFQVRAAGGQLEGASEEPGRLRSGQVVIGMCDPLGQPQAVVPVAESGATLFALELLPRITRAQSMDVL
ncbi:MAG: NAD(P)(+) transhydrogenase (Re/Si-specific) subunit alpha, partial [Pirellulales bacterium]|nr:NAD(P)(+) transhydrogenase (Re/Si-specific) subunit alpha [Pirellulales bacterium]